MAEMPKMQEQFSALALAVEQVASAKLAVLKPAAAAAK